ncbi:hypothetical protein [Sphingopyxis granuli]|uniref:hypothetical protein n=1 Tax=Sphingopyxis granuli TaxID=267128 RepID=UPI0030B8E919
MTWLQENWIIAVVGLVVAIALLWGLFGRSKAEEAAPPTVAPAEPRKPLEPTKPDIVAAEPARFKPVEPAPAPIPPAPPRRPRPPKRRSRLQLQSKPRRRPPSQRQPATICGC